MTDAPLDLTPQEHDVDKQFGVRSGRNWIIVLLFLFAAGFILFKALTSARVYFYNVDEALAQKESLAADSFRMQGEVLTLSDPESTEFIFTVGYGGETAVVRHVGSEPSDLFVCGQNVVVKGRWQGEEFLSEQILVKHSEEYREENAERLEGVAQQKKDCGISPTAKSL